eukprot:COSAG02_NODE_457_length_21950_cov_35.452794_15_plen_56_part_00
MPGCAETNAVSEDQPTPYPYSLLCRWLRTPLDLSFYPSVEGPTHRSRLALVDLFQ